MRRIILLFLMPVCFHTAAQEPEITLPFQGKNFRFRVSAGIALFTAGKQLEQHFNRNGFDDTYQNFSTKFIGQVLGGDGKTEYPVSTHFPFVLELSTAYRLARRHWLGFILGWDNRVVAEGFDKAYTTNSILGKADIGHFVTLGHSAWFLSPQWSVKFPNSRFGMYGGPSLDFHKLDDADRKRFRRIGAIIGARAELVAALEVFAAFRWSPNMHFEKQERIFENNGLSITSTLPAKEVNFSHLRFGFSYGFQTGNRSL